MNAPIFVCGALMAAAYILLGALGAHALEASLSLDSQATYATANRYLGYHGLGLLVIALLAAQRPRLVPAAWVMAAGCLIFAGSLFTLSLGGPVAMAWLAPLGGFGMLGGWLALAWMGARCG